ncbi:unnamed protein product, partial [Laminaria digitata]
ATEDFRLRRVAQDKAKFRKSERMAAVGRRRHVHASAVFEGTLLCERRTLVSPTSWGPCRRRKGDLVATRLWFAASPGPRNLEGHARGREAGGPRSGPEAR